MVGHFSDRPPRNESEQQLDELMQNYQMDLGNGSTITMGNIMKGYSLSFALLFLWTGVLGLFLVKQFKENPQALKKACIVYTGALVLLMAIGLKYFFFIPNTCVAICLIFFAISVFRIK
jgi:hypothetical protein